MSRVFASKGSGIGDITQNFHEPCGYPFHAGWSPEAASEFPFDITGYMDADVETIPLQTKVGCYVSLAFKEVAESEELNAQFVIGSGNCVSHTLPYTTVAEDVGNDIVMVFQVDGVQAGKHKLVKLRTWGEAAEPVAPAEVWEDITSHFNITMFGVWNGLRYIGTVQPATTDYSLSLRYVPSTGPAVIDSNDRVRITYSRAGGGEFTFDVLGGPKVDLEAGAVTNAVTEVDLGVFTSPTFDLFVFGKSQPSPFYVDKIEVLKVD